MESTLGTPYHAAPGLSPYEEASADEAEQQRRRQPPTAGGADRDLHFTPSDLRRLRRSSTGGGRASSSGAHGSGGGSVSDAFKDTLRRFSGAWRR